MKTIPKNVCIIFLVAVSILLVWSLNPAMAQGPGSPELQTSSTSAINEVPLPPIFVTQQDEAGLVQRYQAVKEKSVLDNTEGDALAVPSITEGDALLKDAMATSNVVGFYTVGATDLTYYIFREINMPSACLDRDGCRVRMIMQHETDAYDQVRVIDLTIATEYTNNTYGARGRFRGRYGWTRQQGGGDYSWILGDGQRHNIANPWDWAWIVDWRWLQDGKEMGGTKIRLYSHPHVTTRFIFYDN